MLSGMILTGCGDGSGEDWLSSGNQGGSQAVSGTGEVLENDPGQDVQTELLYSPGSSLTEAELTAVLEMLATLHQNLELSEYLGEAIHVVESQIWYETLVKRMAEGGRIYALKKGEETLLSVQIMIDISGEPCSIVYYQKGPGEMILLQHSGSVLRVTTAGVLEGMYNGAVEIWEMDAATGRVSQEKGLYTQGVPVGEHIMAVKEGDGEEEFYNLWNMRESMEYEKTVTTYDQGGIRWLHRLRNPPQNRHRNPLQSLLRNRHRRQSQQLPEGLRLRRHPHRRRPRNRLRRPRQCLRRFLPLHRRQCLRRFRPLHRRRRLRRFLPLRPHRRLHQYLRLRRAGIRILSGRRTWSDRYQRARVLILAIDARAALRLGEAALLTEKDLEAGSCFDCFGMIIVI